jgi:hypothetical protein
VTVANIHQSHKIITCTACITNVTRANYPNVRAWVHTVTTWETLWIFVILSELQELNYQITACQFICSITICYRSTSCKMCAVVLQDTFHKTPKSTSFRKSSFKLLKMFLTVYMQEAVNSHEQATKQNKLLSCWRKKLAKIFCEQIFFIMFNICHKDKIWHNRVLMCWHYIWMFFC